ncbi:MAG TPA: FHA domain-containing protein, partial [Acidimicrobiales bacterium]
SLLLPDGNRISLGDDPVTIGRLPDCDVVLEDRNISRRHAEVRRIPNGFVVVDLDSTNGTRVNGAGVKERRLEDGDEITLGSSKIRFEAS